MQKIISFFVISSFIFIQGCSTIAGGAVALSMEEEYEEQEERSKASRKLDCPYEHTKEDIFGYYCNEKQVEKKKERRKRLDCDDNEKVSYSATGYYCEDKY